MSTETSVPRCPGCGAGIPSAAPHGLCPKCLLAGVAQPTEPAATVEAADDRLDIAAVAAAFPYLELIECIGQGGMGMVYKARQVRLGRFVALKILSQRLAGGTAFRERFTREGLLLARLNHPNIVTVYDVGETAGFLYLLMEYVDGANLRQAMRAGRFSPAQALEIVPKICEALQFAHAEGVLHRDIKPENILLDTRGRVKIADFGIAKLLGERGLGSTLTATGAAVGTPQYMAPEQLEHPQDVDHRADIYSLGVVFYELLTGELPLGRFAPPSEKTPVGTRVDEVVFRTLEKEREKRYQTVGEVKTEVESIAVTGAMSAASPRPPAPSPLAPTGGVPGASGLAAEPGAAVAAPTSSPGGPTGDNGLPSAFGLRPEHRPLVLMGLAVVLALLGLRLLPLPALLIGTVAASLHAGVGPALWTACSVAVGGWLIYEAWLNRRRLLEPLGVPASELEWSGTAPLWASDRILGTMAVAVLMAVTTEVAIQATLLLSALLSLVVSSTWPSVIAAVAGSALAWWLLRVQATSVPCAPAPLTPAQRRVGLLFLTLGGVAFLPAIASPGLGVRHWQLDALLAVTGVALLTRSRPWRAVALGINTVLSAVGATQVLNLLLLAARQPVTSPMPESVLSPVLALVLAVFETLAFVAGAAVLGRRDVRLSFGLAQRSLLTAEPTAATKPHAKSSRKALWSVALVGASMTLAVPIAAMILPAAMVVRHAESGSLSTPAVLLLGGSTLVTFGAAVTGTLLGIVARRDIRNSAGQLRGQALAVIGALAWPVVFALLTLVPLTSIAYRTLRRPSQAVAPVAGTEAVIQGVAFAYRIPAGQVAVFEIVAEQDGRVVTMPGGATFALAPPDALGEVVLQVDPVSPGGTLAIPYPWRVQLTYGNSRAETTDLRLPIPANPTASSVPSVGLEPDGELISLFPRSAPEQASIGVRARTRGHGLPEVTPGGPRSLGVGTNWLAHAKPDGG